MIALLAALLALSSTASAQTPQICNHGEFVVDAALATPNSSHANHDNHASHGWLRILPGQCRFAPHAPSNQPFYIHARSAPFHKRRPFVFQGHHSFCVEPHANFHTPNQTSCPLQGYAVAGFAPAAPGGRIVLNGDPVQYRSARNARVAGFQRLLFELGYDPGVVDGLLGSKTVSAIKQFQRAVNLRPSGKPSPELLQQLADYAQSLKLDPPGLTLCNSTPLTVWSAVAYEIPPDHPDALRGALHESVGWFKVSPNSCSHVVQKPLDGDAYFLYAEAVSPSRSNLNNPQSAPPARLWKGNFSMCLARSQFQIAGRGSCSQRGYRQVGFQRLNILQNAPSFTFTFTSASTPKDN